ncbi:MAG: tRNA pseudouridine(55) synthase TruB [Clostridia bacterium]|nr:tRNA pseudouridine(55) synthase TruB [Clostridia bacterium]
MNGFINYYKPSGISSAYAINRIKKLFKGCKIGHLGTLDPLAEGVLPLAIGKSTRLFDFLLDKQKEYVAEFTFGYQTDTLDRGGKVVSDGGSIPSKEDILRVIPSLVGKISQVPPMFSAKNVGGQRSYDLARRGVTVELKPKEVEIDEIVLLDYNFGKANLKITCKGGTYIRSICRDMASLLNTFATMTKLKRTKSGAFTEETAIAEEDLRKVENLSELIVQPDSVLSYEKITLNDFETTELLNGRPFDFCKEDGVYSVYASDNSFIGIGIAKDKSLKIKAFIKDL